MVLKEIINKEWVIKTGACHQCNLEFCNNNYDDCILIKKSEAQKGMGQWLYGKG